MIVVKVAVQCYVNGVIEILCQYLQSAQNKYMAGRRRTNFEGLAFASKAILRKNTSDHAVSRLCLHFPLNNSKILEKGVIIHLMHMQSVAYLKNCQGGNPKGALGRSGATRAEGDFC